MVGLCVCVISSNLLPRCVCDYVYFPAKKFIHLLAPHHLPLWNSSQFSKSLNKTQLTAGDLGWEYPLEKEKVTHSSILA